MTIKSLWQFTVRTLYCIIGMVCNTNRGLDLPPLIKIEVNIYITGYMVSPPK